MPRVTITLLATVACYVGAASSMGAPNASAESELVSIFRNDSSTSVELRSAGLVVTLNIDPWHVEIRNRATARPVVAEHPVEARAPGRRATGSLGFLVGPQNEPRAGRARWYRVTSVDRIAAKEHTVEVVAATNDPSGRRLLIELGFPSPGAMTVLVTPRPADGVLEVADGFRSEHDESYFGLSARFGPLNARGSEVHARVLRAIPAPGAVARGVRLGVRSLWLGGAAWLSVRE